MFLYLAYQAVHSANLVEDPLQAPSYWVRKFRHIKNVGRRKYAAMVASMDHGIGMVCCQFFMNLLFLDISLQVHFPIFYFQRGGGGGGGHALSYSILPRGSNDFSDNLK